MDSDGEAENDFGLQEDLAKVYQDWEYSDALPPVTQFMDEDSRRLLNISPAIIHPMVEMPNNEVIQDLGVNAPVVNSPEIFNIDIDNIVIENLQIDNNAGVEVFNNAEDENAVVDNLHVEVDNPEIGTPEVEVSDIKCSSLPPWAKRLSLRFIESFDVRSYKQLLKLVDLLKIDLAEAVRECMNSRNRSEELVGGLKHFLWYFYSLHSKLKPSSKKCFAGANAYKGELLFMQKVTAMLAFYLDIELSAAKNQNKPLSEIMCRIFPYLDTFLDSNQDLMVNVVLKSRLMALMEYSELTTPIFEKLLIERSETKRHPFTYARRLLAFKMWKYSARTGDERRNITNLAKKHLRLPHKFKANLKRGFLKNVFLIPKKMTCNLAFYIMRRRMDLQKSIELFLNAESETQHNHLMFGIFKPAACSVDFSDDDDRMDIDKTEDEAVGIKYYKIKHYTNEHLYDDNDGLTVIRNDIEIIDLLDTPSSEQDIVKVNPVNKVAARPLAAVTAWTVESPKL